MLQRDVWFPSVTVGPRQDCLSGPVMFDQSQHRTGDPHMHPGFPGYIQFRAVHDDLVSPGHLGKDFFDERGSFLINPLRTPAAPFRTREVSQQALALTGNVTAKWHEVAFLSRRKAGMATSLVLIHNTG